MKHIPKLRAVWGKQFEKGTRKVKKCKKEETRKERNRKEKDEGKEESKK